MRSAVDFHLLRWIAAIVGALAAPMAAAATFSVDTSADNPALNTCTAAAADCSLRGAIAAANLAADVDTVAFNIPPSDAACTLATGVCRITLANPGTFPNINQPLLIDGYTQPGALPNTIPAPGANNAVLKIEITSAVVADDWFLPNNTSFTLRGVAMLLPGNRMVSGFGTSSVSLQGNWFGVTAAGISPDYSTQSGVLGLSTIFRRITVGGPNPGDRNVIAGSGRDLSNPPLPGGGSNLLRANSAVADRAVILFQGNLFGFAPDGITPLPFRDALTVSSGDDGFETPDIRILDNRFGRAQRVFGGGVGGAVKFTVSRVMTTPAVFQGNVFGLGVDGSRSGVERGHIEVFLGNNTQVARVQIGGLLAGQANVFAAGLRQEANVATGSALTLPTGAISSFVEFAGNQMLGNDGIGLDFPSATASYGRSANDADDADSGANNQQNFAKIASFGVSAGQFSVNYRVDSTLANSAYPLRVDFYKALGDEGEVLLDSDVYTSASAQQSKAATLTIPPGVSLNADDVVVAVATDAQGRSSEFSFDLVGLSVSDTPDPHPAGLPFTVSVDALALEGPFKPNGVVDVSMNSSTPLTCSITLAPTAIANTSRGNCALLPTQAGNFTLTANYRTLRGAFGSASGGDVVATATHQVSVAGPEQLGFARCRQNVVEGETAQVRVERPSGGVASVSVEFNHVAGTATPGDDYAVPASQLLSWAPGDSSAKLIDIAIAAEAQIEPIERFRLTLTNPSGAALLPFAQLDVEILDGVDDARFRNGFEGAVCLP
jgi:hypothetical protein